MTYFWKISLILIQMFIVPITADARITANIKKHYYVYKYFETTYKIFATTKKIIKKK